MSVHAASTQSFRALLRIASSSAASPPWFAIPIEADDRDDALEVCFKVATSEQIRVDARDDRLTIWSYHSGTGQSAMRVCVLPFRILTERVQSTRIGDVLRVRIFKPQPERRRKRQTIEGLLPDP